MNYLAHILLAGSEPEAQLGGLLGDFARPGMDGDFSVTIQREIQLHRRIDSFTDAHELVLGCKAKFRRHTRRFAGIILDVLFDHFLASDWAVYCEYDRVAFIADFYAYLSQTQLVLPHCLKLIAPKLVKDDWLGSYADVAGFEMAIHGLARRLKRGGNQLIDGLHDVTQHKEDFRAAFSLFFPQLQRYAFAQRQCLIGV